MALEDYKDIVGTAASVCTIGQFFAGMFICKDIVTRGTTKNISVIPFLGGLVIGCLMGLYSIMLNDEAMIQVNVAGLLLNVGYYLCYLYYCADKRDLGFKTMQSAGIVALALWYVRWEDPAVVEFRFGLVVTALLMTLIASPLFSLGDVIRTQSTESLPFPMIVSGTLVSFLWLLYSIILQNRFLQAQNVVGLALCLIQLSLFAIYPSKSKLKSP